jgi:hypothetical protein
MAAALLTGLFLGVALAAAYVASARSRFQERMQRKVLYWQAEAARARQAAEELSRRPDAREARSNPPTGQEWQ